MTSSGVLQLTAFLIVASVLTTWVWCVYRAQRRKRRVANELNAAADRISTADDSELWAAPERKGQR